jgi:D-alanyl-D-alanine carboxypeptidase
LVNKQHKLPADWESKVELVEVKNAFDEDIKVEKEAYEQYLKLRDALLEEGVDIELDSVYRSVSRQEELWAEFEEEY